MKNPESSIRHSSARPDQEPIEPFYHKNKKQTGYHF